MAEQQTRRLLAKTLCRREGAGILVSVRRLCLPRYKSPSPLGQAMHTKHSLRYGRAPRALSPCDVDLTAPPYTLHILLWLQVCVSGQVSTLLSYTPRLPAVDIIQVVTTLSVGAYRCRIVPSPAAAGASWRFRRAANATVLIAPRPTSAEVAS